MDHGKQKGWKNTCLHGLQITCNANTSRPDQNKDITRNEIWSMLETIATQPNTSIHIQWIPGHCGISGNEEADHLANRGQLEPQDNTEIDYASAKAVLKRHILETEWAPRNTH